MNYKKIVITGGSGQVGKSLKKFLPEAIYLSSSDYNLTSEKEVAKMYFELKPDCVIHLAAKVGGILDNIQKPAEYFTDNIMMNTLLVDYAYRNKVERFVGILSSCIFPDKHDSYPMHETDMHAGPPTPTNYAYGYAKRCLAVQVEAYNKQYGTKYQYLIPCNLYGEFDKYGDNSHFVAALIKKIHFAKEAKSEKITLFGTGTPLRQFMYADDLARVINECLEKDIYENMNVVTDENLSIKQMAEIAIKACDAEHLKIEFDPSYPDGQFRKDVSTDKLKTVIPDFKAVELYDGIKLTYKYLIDNKIL